MKKKFAIGTIILIMVATVSAQSWIGNQHMLSAAVGWGSMLGDLGGAAGLGTYGLKDFNYEAMSPSYTLGYSFTKNKNPYIGLAFKADLSYSRISSCDYYTENGARGTRNISRISDIVELAAGFEFYFLKQTISAFKKGSFKDIEKGSAFKTRIVRSEIPISMYVILQAGGIWFDCKGKYTDDKWYSLRELRTEGQGLLKSRKYPSCIQGVGVLGLGIKHIFTPSFAMKIEASMHITTTDYLDDISVTYISPNAVYDLVLKETNDSKKAEMAKYFADGLKYDKTLAPGQIRGNALKNDAYFFVQLGFCYVIQSNSTVIKNSFK